VLKGSPKKESVCVVGVCTVELCRCSMVRALVDAEQLKGVLEVYVIQPCRCPPMDYLLGGHVDKVTMELAGLLTIPNQEGHTDT
jgi:hypothetical protein